MANRIELTGFEAFSTYTESLNANSPPVFFFFSGAKLPSGVSWCPDCVEAAPVVMAYLDELKTDLTFAYVDVGDRDYWKNPACPFRTDSRTRLMVIPTLLKWKGVQRLEGSQCNKRELLEMMFGDEE